MSFDDYVAAHERTRCGIDLPAGRVSATFLVAALLVCDDDNLSSATIIERAGGELENIVGGDDGQMVRRYWVR